MAIDAANNETTHPGSDTLALQAGCTYSLPAAPTENGDDTDASGHESRFWWYGPAALPAIASTIVIEGHGAIISRPASASVPYRLFYVGADPANPDTENYASPRAGNLALANLTLRGGLAKGGDSARGGGGGMGGAIFNQGSLTLQAVTLTDNTAQGGSGADTAAGDGGGGIGADAPTHGGGGFGAGFDAPAGAAHGGFGSAGGFPFGGGGGGFSGNDDGAPASYTIGGAGGGPATGTGGGGGGSSAGGNGSGGGGSSATGSGGTGGGFGGGGSGAIGGIGGGGGGVGGGGGFGGGGFSGGGGLGAMAGNNGGFGGDGGFGGGGGSGVGFGGGGAGLGGAVFNMQGTVTLVNTTFAGNRALAGAGGIGAGSGQGLGGALFNLSGTITVSGSTFAGNRASQGGADLYNLVYDATTARAAAISVSQSILGSADLAALVSDKPATVYGGTGNLGTAGVTLSDGNIVVSQMVLGGGTISGSAITSNPELYPLADNGGMVPTLALAPGSPAIDAVIGNCALSVDARGQPRPADGDGDTIAMCDMGASERQGPHDSDVIFIDGFDTGI